LTPPPPHTTPHTHPHTHKQTLSLSPAPGHEALLRRVHAHAAAHQAIPALTPTHDGPMDLRGLRPALARVALAEALALLEGGEEEEEEEEGEGEEEGRPPLVLITGTGPVKASTRRFLRSRACFDPPFNPLPMPYNHGRLLLPWSQIRRWRAAGAHVRLSLSWAEGDGHRKDDDNKGPRRRRRQQLWGGMGE
jgi:hypothetical protein